MCSYKSIWNLKEIRRPWEQIFSAKDIRTDHVQILHRLGQDSAEVVGCLITTALVGGQNKCDLGVFGRKLAFKGLSVFVYFSIADRYVSVLKSVVG